MNNLHKFWLVVKHGDALVLDNNQKRFTFPPSSVHPDYEIDAVLFEFPGKDNEIRFVYMMWT